MAVAEDLPPLPDLAEMSLRSAVVTATQYLAARGIVDAAADARRLVIHAIQAAPLELVTHPDRTLAAHEAARLGDALRRRSAGEPVSRIRGWRGFYGRDFEITAATLDPRPETETLVDAALQIAAIRWPQGRDLEIIDIGTGSGCLLITLLAELPLARGVGVDISRAALHTAERNAARLDVGARSTWVEGRNFAVLGRRFPLIVSNPPYIPTGDIGALDRDVRHYDPATALDGGPDGLDVYREIAAALSAHSAPGWVLMEAGDGQAVEIMALVRQAMPEARLGAFVIHLDMAGKQRCVAIQVQN